MELLELTFGYQRFLNLNLESQLSFLENITFKLITQPSLIDFFLVIGEHLIFLNLLDIFTRYYFISTYMLSNLGSI
jgi:hypothetical protein